MKRVIVIKAGQVYLRGLLKSDQRDMFYKSVYPWISEEYRKIKRLVIVPQHTSRKYLVKRDTTFHATKHNEVLSQGLCRFILGALPVTQIAREGDDLIKPILIQADTICKCLNRFSEQAPKFYVQEGGVRNIKLYQKLPNSYGATIRPLKSNQLHSFASSPNSGLVTFVPSRLQLENKQVIFVSASE